MKVRVIDENNIIISNMMMMISGGFSFVGFSKSYILRSYFGCMPLCSNFVLGVEFKSGDYGFKGPHQFFWGSPYLNP